MGRTREIIYYGEVYVMARNQMLGQMNQAALERLAGRDPAGIAKNAGIHYDTDTQKFRFPSMGMELEISCCDYEITPAVSTVSVSWLYNP